VKPAEVITLREIIKESYPFAKMDNERGDDVWYVLLKDYQFQPMHNSLVSWIKAGNKFPPSIADLIARYDDTVKETATGVIAMMDEDGYFDDPEDASREIAIWNHNQRLRKANMWSQNGKGPDWFMRDYQTYYDRMFPTQIGSSETKKLDYVR
jgi:hypothetical protein